MQFRLRVRVAKRIGITQYYFLTPAGCNNIFVHIKQVIDQSEFYVAVVERNSASFFLAF